MSVSAAHHGTLNASRPNPTAKVLFVDEDCEDLDSNCSILKEHGCEVRACRSVREGVHCLDDEPFDFVVVCQGSHRFEGRHVLEHAIEINRHRPVVILTRSLNMSCYLEAMQLGAVDYIEKPISPLDVARVIKTHARVQHHAA